MEERPSNPGATADAVWPLHRVICRLPGGGHHVVRSIARDAATSYADALAAGYEARVVLPEEPGDRDVEIMNAVEHSGVYGSACLNCGYDLSGLAPAGVTAFVACPECGVGMPRALGTPRPRERAALDGRRLRRSLVLHAVLLLFIGLSLAGPSPAKASAVVLGGLIALGVVASAGLKVRRYARAHWW